MASGPSKVNGHQLATPPFWDRREIILESDLDSVPKLLLLILNDYAGDNGHAYPSQTTLGRRVSKKPRQLRRIVEELVHDNLLSVESGVGRQSSRYSINWGTLAQRSSATAVTTHSGHPRPGRAVAGDHSEWSPTTTKHLKNPHGTPGAPPSPPSKGGEGEPRSEEGRAILARLEDAHGATLAAMDEQARRELAVRTFGPHSREWKVYANNSPQSRLVRELLLQALDHEAQHEPASKPETNPDTEAA